MAQEIERKYLVEILGDFEPDRSRIIESAYLSVGDPEVRIARYRGQAGSYQLTVKQGKGLVREEIIFDVADKEGATLFEMSTYRVAKIRDDFRVGTSISNKSKWEIDTYLGRHRGLVIAEVELPYPTYVPDRPPFLRICAEVTEDDRFKNRRLATATDEEVQALLLEFCLV